VRILDAPACLKQERLPPGQPQCCLSAPSSSSSCVSWQPFRSLQQHRSASGEPLPLGSQNDDRDNAIRGVEDAGSEQRQAHPAALPVTPTSPPTAAAPLQHLWTGPGLQSALPAAHAAAIAAVAHNHPSPPPLHILRSSQLDAARLDAELTSLLGEQLGRVFALFNPVRAEVPRLHLLASYITIWFEDICSMGLGGWSRFSLTFFCYAPILS